MTFARAHTWILPSLLLAACHVTVGGDDPADGTPCDQEEQSVCIARDQALVCTDGVWEEVRDTRCRPATPPPEPFGCTSTDDCQAGSYCTVEDGVCNSACDGRADSDDGERFSCAAVCTGTCEPIPEPPPVPVEIVCTSSEGCPSDTYCSVEDGECNSGCLQPFDAAISGEGEAAVACPDVCTGVCKDLKGPVPPSPVCSSSEQCTAGSYCTVEDGVCNGCAYDAPAGGAAGAAEPAPACDAVCLGTCEVLPSPTPRACASSEECGVDEHCSTEDGVCDSACDVSAGVSAEADAPVYCPAVCMGTCVTEPTLVAFPTE